MIECLSAHHYLLLNCFCVFLLGAVYSYVELLEISTKAKQIWEISWGWIYIFGNGCVAVLALLISFWGDVNERFLWGKLLIAGTSGLALLRVLSINLKEKGVEDRSFSIAQVLQKRIYSEFDRSRSRNDLVRLKEMMRPFNDYLVIADNLPLLLTYLLKALTEREVQTMKEEIEKFKQVKEGSDKIKCINLGAILSRFTGMDLLESTLSELQEELLEISSSPMSEGGNKKDIDSYLNEFA